MENKDILDDEQQQTNPQTDSADHETLTTDEAVTVNGGTAGGEGQAATESAEDKTYKELVELKDKYLRLYADFENFRRRTAKEKMELIANANEGMLVALLPVVDDFERAMQAIDKAEDVAAVKEGVSLIYHKLSRTLESKGLKPMVAKGEVFNADLHESITQFPAPSDDLKGKVIDETERGYYLNDKVIRFAKVIVGS
ncbi:nucleotide exchange factor GrpE [Rudanella paleaurantiibacter]|uniref:Protein GrpE n=1 Tax=Rudanella paleaurantiibacter TaxID=2614655 RepID=A0A7J5U400_9BACT|nr:nucleotide exchange factor GrpE [Rudanella paleaurantiibacter]KAB7732568.1 nucleotide exchange factor GrpE [Rudanella paleaurantiibacter]